MIFRISYFRKNNLSWLNRRLWLFAIFNQILFHVQWIHLCLTMRHTSLVGCTHGELESKGCKGPSSWIVHVAGIVWVEGWGFRLLPVEYSCMYPLCNTRSSLCCFCFTFLKWDTFEPSVRASPLTGIPWPQLPTRNPKFLASNFHL